MTHSGEYVSEILKEEMDEMKSSGIVHTYCGVSIDELSRDELKAVISLAIKDRQRRFEQTF